MTIRTSVKLVGLIGNPVKHSISPRIHNEAFKYLNLEYYYIAVECDAKDLREVIKSFVSLGAIGFNVTIPFKQVIIKYVDRLIDDASILKTVNTIVISNGRLLGYNTDVAGAIASLSRFSERISNGSSLILGSGGAAYAVALALIKLGCKRLTISNRTLAKANKLASFIKRNFKLDANVTGIGREELTEIARESDVIVNTTSVGMWPNVDESLLLKDQIRPGTIVMDIVYNPLETKLLKEARAAGAICISGLDMFLTQAAESFKLWTGIDPPLDLIRNVAIDTLVSWHERKS